MQPGGPTIWAHGLIKAIGLYCIGLVRCAMYDVRCAMSDAAAKVRRNYQSEWKGGGVRGLGSLGGGQVRVSSLKYVVWTLKMEKRKTLWPHNAKANANASADRDRKCSLSWSFSIIKRTQHKTLATCGLNGFVGPAVAHIWIYLDMYNMVSWICRYLVIGNWFVFWRFSNDSVLLLHSNNCNIDFSTLMGLPFGYIRYEDGCIPRSYGFFNLPGCHIKIILIFCITIF